MTNMQTNILRLRNVRILCLSIVALAISQKSFSNYSDGWRVYPSFSDITEIEPTGREVYVLASNSIYSYNPSDGLITVYDKTNVMSDVEISHIAWSGTNRRLVITYTNSNIDLLTRNGDVINVPDLYMFGTTADKTINDIYIHNEYAYISTGFGIMKLNVAKGSIDESYQLGFAVDHCYIDGNTIYAASSSQGVYCCDMRVNVLDKNNWTFYGNYTPDTADKTNVYDASTKYWWTTTDSGKLTYYTIDADGNRTYMTEGVAPDGPASNNFYRIYINGGSLYGVGGIWSQDVDGMRKGEIHVWNGSSWSEFEPVSESEIGHRYIDVLCLDFDPTTSGRVMVGGKSGMFEFVDGKFVNHYNYYNSPLTSAVNPASKNYTIVTSLKYDQAGNLWLLNSHTGNSIKSIASGTGEWTTYEHPEFSIENCFNLQKLFISPTNGKLWFVNNYYANSLLYSYDRENDVVTRYGPTFINQNGTSVSPNYVYCTTEDKDGNVWIGTSAGPLYLSANSIQGGSDVFTQYVVPRNDGTNYGDYLLTGIETRAIAIDGGNRKWIGTNGNGVFLISGDNNTQIQHFTADNSPLLSDIIQDIVVNGQTGEVFFATDKGLCSYIGDATEPATEMTKDNVYAYPNPVRPDYTGLITIVGLTYDADIKIVTSNGSLVNQGRSTGGTYTWDGCDLDGRRVASGVYMVQTATSTGEKGTVCKIAIVN